MTKPVHTSTDEGRQQGIKVLYRSWPDRKHSSKAYIDEDCDQWQRHYGENKHTGESLYVVWHEKDECWYEEPTQVTDAQGRVWENHGFHSDDFLAFGGHESHIVEIAKGLLPEGGTFVDVGAHVGLFSVNLMEKAGVIHALEANHVTASTLHQNMQNNESLRRKGMEANLYALAAWDKDREALNLVEVRGMETGGSTHCSPQDKEDSNAGATESITLDTLLGDKPADLIKIDVEGAEARVLRGASKVLDEQKPTLLIEMHDRVKVYDLPTVRAEVIEILESHNYRWDDSLLNGEECYYMVARPNTPEEPDLGFEIDIVRSEA